MTLTPELGAAFARAALANVTREYPRKLDHLLTEAQLMRAVLPDAEFGPWLAVFLPNGLGPLAIPPAFPTAPTHNSPTSTGGDYVGEHWLASFAALALGEAP